MVPSSYAHCAALVIIFISFQPNVFGQVCSPIGQICTYTTDCCKGCCEAHTCVDRSFSCSADMIAQPGYETCTRFYCPPEHICYLRETCPPENPCPRAPSCRRVDFTNNQTNYRYYRNEGNMLTTESTTIIIFTLFTNFVMFM